MAKRVVKHFQVEGLRRDLARPGEVSRRRPLTELQRRLIEGPALTMPLQRLYNKARPKDRRLQRLYSEAPPKDRRLQRLYSEARYVRQKPRPRNSEEKNSLKIPQKSKSSSGARDF